MIQQFLSETGHRMPVGNFYISLPFWACFALVVLIYRLAPGNATAKSWLLLGASICMLMTLPSFNLLTLLVLVGLSVVTYHIGAILNRDSQLTNRRTRVAVAVIGIAAVLCVLAFFKYSFVQVMLRRWAHNGVAPADFIFLIGISYSSFKSMHFIIEGFKKGIKNPSFLSFLNYILFFPAFISGPINRYNHFIENSDLAGRTKARLDILPGLQRIIHGLFKKIVLVAIVAPYTIKNMAAGIQQKPLWQILLGLYALALYFYFDFSGYTDLAIGSARIMGFVLPENFNFPFLKKNIQQLWANWHMSLTSWLTDYIYWPLVGKLRDRDFLRTHPVLLSNIAIVITFAICGLWHGNSLNFLLWGTYQGFGMAVVNTYQSWKRKIRHPIARKYFTSPYSFALGALATFNFFALGQSLFVLDAHQIRMLLERVV